MHNVILQLNIKLVHLEEINTQLLFDKDTLLKEFNDYKQTNDSDETVEKVTIQIITIRLRFHTLFHQQINEL